MHNSKQSFDYSNHLYLTQFEFRNMSQRTLLFLLFLTILIICKADKDNPLEYLKDTFQIVRPFSVDETGNENVTFHCKPEKGSQFDECFYKTPHGKQFQTQLDGSVLDTDTNEIVAGITAFFESDGKAESLLKFQNIYLVPCLFFKRGIQHICRKVFG